MSNNKYSYNDVMLYIEKLGYAMIDSEYINNRTKITIVDANGYYYFICLSKLKAGDIPRMADKRNPYTIQNIQLWCKLNNKPFKLVSEDYEGTNEKLKWKCLSNKCNETFQINWHNISQGQTCPYCSGQKVGLSNCLATANPSLSYQWHPTKNNYLTPYDVTCFSGKKVWWLCNKNPKHEWYATIASRNICDCPYCAGLLPSEDYNLLVCNPILCEEWNYNKNKKKPSEFTPYSGYEVWWKCKDCEHEWSAKISNRNKGRGCPECNSSKGEKIISQLLDVYHVFYIAQKTFNALRGVGNGLLSYDFYLPEYKLLIEYQGEQHEHYCQGFHKSKNDFRKQQEHDKRKREHAQTHNINLLEIWYWDFDNIEDILKDKLSLE